MKLWYFAHRYSDKNPVKQTFNLMDAKFRKRTLESEYESRGIRLWAPWLELAEARIPEHIAWNIISHCVRICAGIVLDLDGADEPSPGMVRERKIMETVGGEVEVVR